MKKLNTINQKIEDSYDEQVYSGRAFPQAHPNRLYVIGCLCGLSPEPVDKCRVLELGCATGENIIPMAFHLPQSEFVGADISLLQIQKAKEVIKGLDLENIEVKKADLMEIDESWGKFDYIISHGVYSWVPEEVENKVLEISSQNLAKNGLAYISYGTFPGCNTKMMAREMILYHTKKFSDNQQKFEQARALLEFIKSYTEEDSTYYKQIMQSYEDMFSSNNESCFFHDYTENYNRPSYFKDFMKKAGESGLAFVHEAEVGSSSLFGLPPEIQNTLNSVCSTFEEKEQYFDFLENRSFRQSILCSSDEKANISRNVTYEGIKNLYCYLPSKIMIPDEIVTDGQMQAIRNINNVGIDCSSPLIKNAVKILQESNEGCIRIDDLFDSSFKGLVLDAGVESHTESQKQLFTSGIIQGYTVNFFGLSALDFGYKLTVSEKPKVSRMALFQARNNYSIVNQRHELVAVDALAMKFVSLLDGTNSKKTLLVEFEKFVQAVFDRDQSTIATGAAIEDELNTFLDKFKSIGLFVG